MARNHLDLTGKVAIVTGASRGLGKAMVLALAQAGANVVATARSWEDIVETAAKAEECGVHALAIPVDVMRREHIDAMVNQVLATFGKIDVLVNNAGIAPSIPFLEMSGEMWNQVITTNLTAAFACSQAVGRHMVAHRSGKIINIASTAGLRGKASLVAYSASKGGMVLFTQALAAELAQHNVQVNAIAPGAFITTAQAKVFADSEISARRLAKIPMHRAGDPMEIGPLVVYLASGASDFMTGSVIVIDGGEVCKI